MLARWLRGKRHAVLRDRIEALTESIEAIDREHRDAFARLEQRSQALAAELSEAISRLNERWQAASAARDRSEEQLAALIQHQAEEREHIEAREREADKRHQELRLSQVRLEKQQAVELARVAAAFTTRFGRLDQPRVRSS